MPPSTPIATPTNITQPAAHTISRTAQLTAGTADAQWYLPTRLVADARWHRSDTHLGCLAMAAIVEQADPPVAVKGAGELEPTEQIELLMRDLRSSPHGLS